MITGDSKETATAVAKEIGILDKNCDIKSSVFTGAEFENMPELARSQAVGGLKGKVFARVEP